MIELHIVEWLAGGSLKVQLAKRSLGLASQYTSIPRKRVKVPRFVKRKAKGLLSNVRLKSSRGCTSCVSRAKERPPIAITTAPAAEANKTVHFGTKGCIREYC